MPVYYSELMLDEAAARDEAFDIVDYADARRRARLRFRGILFHIFASDKIASAFSLLALPPALIYSTESVIVAPGRVSALRRGIFMLIII